MIREEIKNNINFSFISDDKFKTNRISINLITKLSEETTSQNALLSGVLERGCETYNSYKVLTEKLYSLYGATFQCSIDKLGNKQIISLSIQSIDDKFTLGNEKMTEEITNLLFDILLKPNFVNGEFVSEIVEVEKSKLIEDIESVINEKRLYVKKQAKKQLFKNTNFATERLGYVDKIKKISNKDLKNAYYSLLENSVIEVIFAGCGNQDIVKNISAQRMAEISNNKLSFSDDEFVSDISKTEIHEEKMDITQGKICLLYTGFTGSTLKDISVMRIANAIFGGAPFSKLFINVREKKSLCYYCDSSYDRTTKVMTVDCGVETQNIDIAIDTINQQLDEMKNNFVSDDELEQSKLMVTNAFLSAKDSLSSLEGFCLGQIITENFSDIEDIICETGKVTKEDIKKAMKQFDLKIIYKLIPNETEVK